jgi:uncharacterized protein YuzE
MKITYDPEADALYIGLRKAEPLHSDDIEEGVVADFDEDGHVVGFEVLDASTRMSPHELSRVSFESLVSEEHGEISLRRAPITRRS